MIAVQAVFWFAVPSGQEILRPTLVSAFKLTPTNAGPTPQEQTDLQSGRVVEETRTLVFPKSFTSAQIRGALVAAYQDRMMFRNTLPNTVQFYGTSHDGTAWT
jgi:hypothetical protein